MGDKLENQKKNPEHGAAPSGAQILEQLDGLALPDLAKTKAAASSGAATSSKKRRITSSLAPRTHVLPVPNGWYTIIGSSELLPGEIVSITAVDRPLVVYRDEKGAAHVFDAHCPHMGAHLGGGRVIGETLRCPFHGWTYDADGQCVDIPYCQTKIPDQARVRSYPVDEKDGFIYFWYHAADAAPTYEIPAVAEVSDPAWTDAHVWQFEVVAALQEMAENNVDYAHFRYVHGRDAIPLDITELSLDGPCSFIIERLPEGMTFQRHTYGPGIAVLQFPGLMTFIATTTPIDRGNCRLLWHFHFPNEMKAAAEDLVLSVTGAYGFQADIPIWRDMQYQERPMLVKGDGPIMAYRRWYAQFYEGN
ncbi:MAG: nitrite reductase/ring-hydroxylating ferredoxin subunit [Hyphomicrobiaceae bacterium]|jgi:nitrite reductase/ring-hydroxylating ferredoxin subunit